MYEADVIEQMVEFMNVLLMGVSVFFAVVSAYVVGLYAFLGRASLVLRVFGFAFLTLTNGLLIGVLYGAQRLHDGLVGTLDKIKASQGLTPAGEAALANAQSAVDPYVNTLSWVGALVFHAGLFYLTFLHPWERVRVAGEDDSDDEPAAAAPPPAAAG